MPRRQKAKADFPAVEQATPLEQATEVTTAVAPPELQPEPRADLPPPQQEVVPGPDSQPVRRPHSFTMKSLGGLYPQTGVRG